MTTVQLILVLCVLAVALSDPSPVVSIGMTMTPIEDYTRANSDVTTIQEATADVTVASAYTMTPVDNSAEDEDEEGYDDDINEDEEDDLDEEDYDDDGDYGEMDEYDDDYGEDDWGGSESDAQELLTGFINGYLAYSVTCGTQLSDFESGVDSVIQGIEQMRPCIDSESSCSSSDISQGFSTIQQGLSSIVSGAEDCAKHSWWMDIKNWANEGFLYLFPELKFVDGVAEILIHGVRVAELLESTYESCTGDEYYSCGDDLGLLAKKISSY
jgi:hypothetical protein